MSQFTTISPLYPQYYQRFAMIWQIYDISLVRFFLIIIYSHDSYRNYICFSIYTCICIYIYNNMYIYIYITTNTHDILIYHWQE